MKRGLIFSFFILGATSIIGQVVILRELIVSFYGNEFFIGVVLASWLAWVGIGSGASGKILNKFKNVFSLLINLHLGVGLLLFLEIFLIRFLKSRIGLAGEAPDLVYGFFTALLAPAPLCLALGIWWTTATKILCASPDKETESDAVNRAYLVETLGFIFGGILFSFILVKHQEFLVAAIVFLFNLGAIIFLLHRQKRHSLLKLAAIFLFPVLILIASLPYLDKLNQIASEFRFKSAAYQKEISGGGQKLAESVNSYYGNIAVTKIDGQYNFYESGLFLGSDEEIQFAENLIHFPLLEHPLPKKILLIGGGFNGAVNEILKHPVEKIYYLELDPKLIEISQKYIPLEFQNALSNPRVELVYADGRYFLKGVGEKFDIIIVNLPDPSTASINRFYTEEFFQTVKEKLNSDGIFATHLTFSPSAPGKNLENLNASLFKTLKKVFEQIIVMPEETIFFLASDGRNLTYQPVILLERFREREIKTKFINEEYIAYRLSNDRNEQALNLFEKNKEAVTNEDFSPVSYFYQTLFWLDRFYPNFSKFFKNLAFSFWQIFAAILIVLTLFLAGIREKLTKISPVLSAGVAGFSLMALEMLVIFLYQIIIGYLYFRIALLISALMAGMALGIWCGNQIIKKGVVKTSSLIKFHLFLIIFCSILPLVFLFLSKNSSVLLADVLLFVSAAFSGLLGAIIFPVSNKIYLSFQPAVYKKTGVVYGADLMGSSLGAMLPALILIPVFGIFKTLIFIASANFWMALILLLPSHSSPKT